MDPLRQSVMVNQFMMVTGSTYEEAAQSLKTCAWNLESALSMFFQGQMLPTSNIRPQMDQMFAPANTPATPPNFSDALLSFAKMSTNTSSSNTPQTSVNNPSRDPHGSNANTTSVPHFAASNSTAGDGQRRS